MKRFLKIGLFLLPWLLLPLAITAQTTIISQVQTFTCSASNFVSALSTAGVFTCSPGAQTNAANVFTAGQAVTPDSSASCGTQSAGGTMTPNFANSNSCLATFGAGNLTIANPSNIHAGQSYVIVLTQDGVGSRTVTSWGSDYKFAGATAPTLSTGASAKDLISCFADTTTTVNCTLAIGNAQ